MPLNVVLYQPEIPQNTGNIMRTCAGTGTKLHLIEPFGFKFDVKHLKRSGVNYLDHVDVTTYPNWSEFTANNPGFYVFLTRYGKKAPSDMDLSKQDQNIYLIFGRESTGVPKAILREHLDQCVRIPINANIRSLNLANSVAIALFEALRQQHYPGCSLVEPDTLKGSDFLEND
jgi:tRNA (cytidine/uridine-2'-O-)-methyltransferase